MNESLTAFKTQFGDKIFNISLDNNKGIPLGFDGGRHIDDIEFGTVGTDEVIKVHETMQYSTVELHYTVYHSSDTVQYVGVMSEKSKDYRPSPLEFR